MGAPLDRQEPAVEEGVAGPAGAPLDFRTIFELEVAYVMRTLRRLGVAPSDVEDMAHEVFLAVHGQLHAYDRARPLRPWLFGFAFRIASHYRRKAQREAGAALVAELPDTGDAPDALLEKVRKRRLVLAALEGVDLDRRAVFVMHEIDGVTCDEVARTLEIPVGTVYSRLRLARQDFAATMRRLQARRHPA
jgi:RNA polymerase sigma-70 factor (ECF subfamily)